MAASSSAAMAASMETGTFRQLFCGIPRSSRGGLEVSGPALYAQGQSMIFIALMWGPDNQIGWDQGMDPGHPLALRRCKLAPVAVSWQQVEEWLLQPTLEVSTTQYRALAICNLWPSFFVASEFAVGFAAQPWTGISRKRFASFCARRGGVALLPAAEKPAWIITIVIGSINIQKPTVYRMF